MACNQELREKGLSYPRTCMDCGFGPCKNTGGKPVQSLADARAEIERLEKEVERIKQTKNMWRDGFKRVMHERDTVWNEAIEAAACKFDHLTLGGISAEILALKRSQP